MSLSATYSGDHAMQNGFSLRESVFLPKREREKEKDIGDYP
jgi:hypothetical protein